MSVKSLFAKDVIHEIEDRHDLPYSGVVIETVSDVSMVHTRPVRGSFRSS
jgi:hypothetical protein